MPNKYELIKKCVEKDVLHFSQEKPFAENLYPSGKKLNWIFDFRPALLKPEFSQAICDVFDGIYKDTPIESIGGLESASIPLVTALSLHSGIPGFYIRKSRKKHSILRQIEGNVSEKNILLVDDLIGSGHSFEKQIKILESEGKEVNHIFTIVQFKNTKSYTFLSERNIKLTSLFQLKDFNINHLENSQKNTLNKIWYFGPKKPHYLEQGPKYKPLITSQKNIFIPSDSGYLWNINIENGTAQDKKKLLWFPDTRHKTFTNVTHDENFLYIGSYNGGLFKIEKKSLKISKKKSFGDSITSTPKKIKDTLAFSIFNTQNGGYNLLLGIDKENFENKWSYPLEAKPSQEIFERLPNSFILSDQKGFIYKINSQGKERWKHKIDGSRLSEITSYGKKNLLCTSMNGYLYVIDEETGRIKEKKLIAQWLYSNPCVKNNIAYIASLDRNVYAYDLKNHKMKWVFESRGRFYSSPIFKKGSIYVGNNEGILYKIDSQTGKFLSSFIISERITNSIQIKDKKIILPSFAGEIYSLEDNLL